MLKNIKEEANTVIFPLLGGIVDDAQALIHQEIALAKIEAKQEIARIQTTIVSLIIGSGLSLLGCFFLCFGLVQLIRVSLPNLPFWLSYCLVALIPGILGVVLLLVPGSKPKDQADNTTFD